MYNCFRYNQALYNIWCLIADQNNTAYFTLDQTLPKDVDIFAYWCANFTNDKNIRVRDLTWYDNIPKLSINKYETPRYHWWGLLWYYFREKTIRIELRIIGCEDDCSIDKKLDCIKRCVSKPNQRMIQNFCGMKRCTIWYLNNWDFKKDLWCISVWLLTMEFTTLDPFFYDCDATEVNEYAIDSSTRAWWIVNFMLENKWTAPTYLRTTIAFTNAIWVNQIKISIGGNTMTINQNVNATDFIDIVWDEREVYYNGVNWIDYLWNIDYLQPWNNSVVIEINGVWTAEIKNLYYNARL